MEKDWIRADTGQRDSLSEYDFNLHRFAYVHASSVSQDGWLRLVSADCIKFFSGLSDEQISQGSLGNVSYFSIGSR